MTDRSEVQERLHRAIAAETETIGPVSEDAEPGDTVPQGECLLSEWVLVSNWIDEAGETWTVTLTSPRLSRTGKLGLLDSHWHR